MWLFKKEVIETGEYDTPLNKAKPVEKSEIEKTFESVANIPFIYGVIPSGIQCIGIGRWPNGTQEQSRDYYTLFRPKQLISKRVFNTPHEAYDFLFQNEKTLNDCGITLDEDALKEKVRRILDEGKTTVI